jgi:hypothetical protein
MVWAVLIFLAVLVGVHWFEYNRAIKEYTFAQPTKIDDHSELRSILSEKTPLVIEIGPLPWHADLDETDVDITTGLLDLDESRAMWWLPGLYNTSVSVLEPEKVVGLQWVSAERTWVGCSAGEPLLIWLVHSRYRRYLPEEDPPVNPWILTSANAPYISRVQFIEVVVKPGWAIGLPAHWGFACSTDKGSSWMWTANQHSGLSWCLTRILGQGQGQEQENKTQVHTESSNSQLEE